MTSWEMAQPSIITVDIPRSTPQQADINKPIFVSLAELIAKPRSTDWLIEDYLEMDSVVDLFGESGAGKSFCAVDMALSIATGTNWHGHAVKQGAVFYVAGEGHGGFAKRFLAWSEHHKVNISNAPLFLSTSAIGLPDEKLLENLIRQITESGHKPVLIIFDTLARSLIGDENSAKDIGAFIQSIDKIRGEFGCCVLTVHHTGHNNAERARGSSALKAAMDTEIGLTMQGELKRLEVSKQKNHEPPKPKYFHLVSAPTPWANDDGTPINSAVLILDEDGTGGTKRNKPKLSVRDDAILTALHRALNQNGAQPSTEIKNRFGGFGGSGASRKVVHVEHWREQAYPIIDAETQGTKKAAFRRAREKLQNLGIVQTMNDYWWIIGPELDKGDGTVQSGTDVPDCTGNSGGVLVRYGTHLYIGVPSVPPTDTQPEKKWDFQNGCWKEEVIE